MYIPRALEAQLAYLARHFPAVLVIDEAQYAPELFPHIKMQADRDRRPGLPIVPLSDMG